MKVEKSYYTVDEVMKICGVQKSKAYATIRTLNKELTEQGFLVFAGRVNKNYFDKRIGRA